jgi:hypothetical protein
MGPKQVIPSGLELNLSGNESRVHAEHLRKTQKVPFWEYGGLTIDKAVDARLGGAELGSSRVRELFFFVNDLAIKVDIKRWLRHAVALQDMLQLMA